MSARLTHCWCSGPKILGVVLQSYNLTSMRAFDIISTETAQHHENQPQSAGLTVLLF